MENINIADNAVKGVSDIIQGVKDKDKPGSPEDREISGHHAAGDAEINENRGVSALENAAADESGAEESGQRQSSPPMADRLLSSPSSDIAEGECPAGEGKEAAEETDEKLLDAEFEALINGRYRNAYRKRTENIVRRRLRGVKVAKNSSAFTGADTAVSTEAENTLKPISVEAPKKNSIVRPAENGVGGSVGVYTRINVSALTGRDVREMIERAASGETISFV